jgi:anti-sigma factor RsiW
MSHEDHGPITPAHCLEMFQQLSEYIDGELDTLTCAEIEKHIEACIPCRICLMTLKQTVKLCKGMEDSPVPRDVSDRLKSLLQGMQRGRGPAAQKR